MLLTFALFLFLVITSSNYVNSQGFPNYGQVNFPPVPNFPPLPNFEVWRDVAATAVDKTLDTVLDKTHHLDEYTFLFAIQEKVLIDMTRKCDCDALYYIDDRLNDYLNSNIPRTDAEADESIQQNDEQPQLEESSDNTLEEESAKT